MGRGTVVIGVQAALSVLGCSIDEPMLTVKDPTIPLRPNIVGDIGPNAAGIMGGWGTYVDTPGCLELGFSADQCSRVVAPAGPAFPPSDLQTGRVCTSGVAARLLDYPDTMTPAYDAMWGAGIQLTLNRDMPYDAVAHEITGFSFEIDRPVPNRMRVNFPTANGLPISAFWGGKIMDDFSPIEAGLNVVRWADVGGPNFVPNPPAFDERMLTFFQIHVAVSPDQATPFDYCVSNLAARTD